MDDAESDRGVQRQLVAVACVIVIAGGIMAASYWCLRKQLLQVVDQEDAFYRHKACIDHPGHPATASVGRAIVFAGMQDPAASPLVPVQGSTLGHLTDEDVARTQGTTPVLRAIVHPMDLRFGTRSGMRARSVAAAPCVSSEQSVMGAFACWGYTEERMLRRGV